MGLIEVLGGDRQLKKCEADSAASGAHDNAEGPHGGDKPNEGTHETEYAQKDKLFAAADGELAKVSASTGRKQLNAKGKSRASFYELRKDNCWTDIALSSWFENLALFVIVCNAIWIGISTDVDETPDNRDMFTAVENVFTVLFTAEIVVRMLSYKTLGYFFSDEALRLWNMFDLVLVALMIVENWCLKYVLEDEGGVGSLSALRLLRLLRISRIFRMVPELGMMVKSMAAAARSVSSTMFLAIGLMYVFAIVFTQWGKKKPAFNGSMIDAHTGEQTPNFWGSLGYSFLSLMQILIYDDTFALIRQTYEENHAMGLLLVAFIVIGAFTVLNMLIGVICEIVSTTRKEEEEKLLMKKIEDLFSQMDADESGTISRDEFEGKAQLLERLGLDQSTVRLAFELIDDDNSGSLEMQEFIHMVFRLLHPPTSQDLLVIKRNIAQLCGIMGGTVFDAPPPMKQGQSKKSAVKKTKEGKDGMGKIGSMENVITKTVANALQLHLPREMSGVFSGVGVIPKDEGKITMADGDDGALDIARAKTFPHSDASGTQISIGMTSNSRAQTMRREDSTVSQIEDVEARLARIENLLIRLAMGGSPAGPNGNSASVSRGQSI